ncbi:hypothetical protein G7062_07720 [Erysipelothrix sp. HDW6C]|uniref:hypothetical protein n=1 Tax=Erysipelothrix sp. HDW6C TaxID=2714930 RepID=UPI00140E86BE|nr:hypothetical protein [Erysipelothrix sp. HDW6C]QIK70182.1 hypothetical protein G7062_07720 [Erysipelothrix sp. HDW6C]
MKILKKYHKQQLSREVMNTYRDLNKIYDLKYNLKDDFDCLKMSVFANGLKTKDTFEKEFERIRNANIDMWDNLVFQERNFIIKCDFAPTKAKLHKFVDDDQNIYIPFFGKLLNSLYDRETAILELPQYFKLYQEFKDKLIPIDIYGLKPFIANMASARYTVGDEHALVLYDNQLATFYRIRDGICDTYPFEQGKQLDKEKVMTLSTALLNDETAFIDLLIAAEYLNPRCVKKIQKQRTKANKRGK